MTVSNVVSVMKKIFPEYASYFKNGSLDKQNDKSIGIFLAPSARTISGICIGGKECSTLFAIPVNIQVRWTEDERECEEVANTIYQTLKFYPSNKNVEDVKVALFENA